MFCHNCGKKVDPADAFCESCGISLKPSSPTHTTLHTDPGATRTPSAPSPAAIPVYSFQPPAPTVIKVKQPHKGLIRLICFIVLIAAAFAIYLCFFTNFFKSDEELIKNRVETFVSDYNSGDFDAFSENFDKKTRNKIKSAIKLTESIFGGLTGYDIGYSELFGLGTTLSEDGLMQLDKIESIEKTSSDTAVVTATMILRSGYGSDYTIETVKFELVKESCGWLNHDWYIRDLGN